MDDKMKKGQIFEGIIETVEFPNKGIVRVQEADGAESVRIIVKNGMPGQKIRFQINKKRKNRCEGRLLEVLETSPLEKNSPVCGQFPGPVFPIPFQRIPDACTARKQEMYIPSR